MASLLNLINTEEISNVTKGLFLIFLAITANFIGETMSCSFQTFLSNNMIAKQVVVYFLIYFTLNYSAKDANSPLRQMSMSVAIYVFYVMLTKTPFNITVAVCIALATMLVIQNCKAYYEKQKDKDKVVLLDSANKLIAYAIIATTVIGFVMYYLKQRRDKGSSFSSTKFIFGVTKCDGSGKL